MAAAVTVLRLGTGTEKTRDAVLSVLKPLTQKTSKPGAPSAAPTDDGEKKPVVRRAPRPRVQEHEPSQQGPGYCIRTLSPRGLFPEAVRLIQQGGGLVYSPRSQRHIILVPEQLVRSWQFRGVDDDQFIYVFPEGVRVVGPEDAARLDRGLEVRVSRDPLCPPPQAPVMK